MTKFVYTLSSVGLMSEWAFFSIKTLMRYVNSRDIVIYFTPPRDTAHIERFEDLGVDVRLVENSTNAFTAFDTSQHYGEKTWVSDIQDDTVVFLDCDTLVFNDIQEVIDGDFQFKARPGTSSVRHPAWANLFKRFDETYIDWMPNAGFFIFKDGKHREIRVKWRGYINQDLGYDHGVNHKEQYALALSIGDLNIKKMTGLEHVMVWNNEFPPNGIVYHIGGAMEGETPADTFKRNMYLAFQKLLQKTLS